MRYEGGNYGSMYQLLRLNVNMVLGKSLKNIVLHPMGVVDILALVMGIVEFCVRHGQASQAISLYL